MLMSTARTCDIIKWVHHRKRCYTFHTLLNELKNPNVIEKFNHKDGFKQINISE